MKFYLDKYNKCHKNDVGDCREFDTPYFDGKADAVIEGYMFVPGGEEAMLDGQRVKGEQYTPWKPSTELDKAQLEYTQQLLKELQENSIPTAELEAAYQEGVNSAYD